MLLQNEFEIDADIDRAWDFFTDLARVMPCLPGAALDGVEGDEYLGNVKIKVGPIGAHFRGTAHFAQKDDASHSAVIAAAGKDPKGQAAANAQIHARLERVSDTRTKVVIDTDLDISGRMAQFGRGAIADVSNRLIGQFVTNISNVIAEDGSSSQPESGTSAPSGDSTGSTASPPSQLRPAAQPDDGGSMDLMSLVGPMVKERFGQAILGGVIGFALSWLVFGRHVRRSQTMPTYGPTPWPPHPAYRGE